MTSTASPLSHSDSALATSIIAVSLPVPSTTSTSGRTAAIRAPDQDSSRTGRQIPAPAIVGPQSQPKLQAILRT